MNWTLRGALQPSRRISAVNMDTCVEFPGDWTPLEIASLVVLMCARTRARIRADNDATAAGTVRGSTLPTLR